MSRAAAVAGDIDEALAFVAGCEMACEAIAGAAVPAADGASLATIVAATAPPAGSASAMALGTFASALQTSTGATTESATAGVRDNQLSADARQQPQIGAEFKLATVRRRLSPVAGGENQVVPAMIGHIMLISIRNG